MLLGIPAFFSDLLVMGGCVGQGVAWGNSDQWRVVGWPAIPDDAAVVLASSSAAPLGEAVGPSVAAVNAEPPAEPSAAELSAAAPAAAEAAPAAAEAPPEAPAAKVASPAPLGAPAVAFGRGRGFGPAASGQMKAANESASHADSSRAAVAASSPGSSTAALHTSAAAGAESTPSAALLGQVSFPKCPARKLLVGGPSLLNDGRYVVRQRLGGGVFGDVHAASVQGSTDEVAVKLLKNPESTAKTARFCASQEAYVLDRCQGHPCIVQLLDAFVEDVPPRRFALVLELWGRDLAEWLRADATRFTAKQIRHCADRCVQGLAHLHGLELLHADIKPRNVLAKLDGVTGLLDCKLSDMGSAQDIGLGVRRADQGLDPEAAVSIQTLNYRAPEILLGSRAFGAVADSWSLGLLLLELAGMNFHRRSLSARWTKRDYTIALFRQLGTPNESSLKELPLWPVSPPLYPPTPWAAEVVRLFGLRGMEFVEGLLCWCPRRRMACSEGVAHPYLHPDSFQLLGGVEAQRYDYLYVSGLM